MKAKRKKAAKSTISEAPRPEIEKCRYCEFNADAGAEAEVTLSKPDDDFEYFESDSEDQKLVYTQVRIPRCIECRAAHDKVDNPVLTLIVYGLIGCLGLGVYFGIYEKSANTFIYAASGIAVICGVIGVAIGAKHNFFMLPNNIKDINDVDDEKQIRALISKGWRIKR